MKQIHNKLYTRSYAMKRLRESNFNVDPINIQYDKNDMRYWTVILNPNKYNIFLTCYLNIDNKEDFYFKLHSSKTTITIKTKSMLVLVDSIKKLITKIEVNN